MQGCGCDLHCQLILVEGEGAPLPSKWVKSAMGFPRLIPIPPHLATAQRSLLRLRRICRMLQDMFTRFADGILPEPEYPANATTGIPRTPLLSAAPILSSDLVHVPFRGPGPPGFYVFSVFLKRLWPLSRSLSGRRSEGIKIQEGPGICAAGVGEHLPGLSLLCQAPILEEEELAGDPPGLGQRMGYKEYGTARPGLILQQ